MLTRVTACVRAVAEQILQGQRTVALGHNFRLDALLLQRRYGQLQMVWIVFNDKDHFFMHRPHPYYFFVFNIFQN